MILHGICREEFNDNFRKKIFLTILPDTIVKIKTRWGSRPAPVLFDRVIINMSEQDISGYYGKWLDYHCIIKKYKGEKNGITYYNEKFVLSKVVVPL